LFSEDIDRFLAFVLLLCVNQIWLCFSIVNAPIYLFFDKVDVIVCHAMNRNFHLTHIIYLFLSHDYVHVQSCTSAYIWSIEICFLSCIYNITESTFGGTWNLYVLDLMYFSMDYWNSWFALSCMY
jgi:hypothetical protein